MFVVGSTGDDVNEYDLSIGFDIATAVYSQAFSVSAQEAAPVGIAFNNDGTKMYIVGIIGIDVNEYDYLRALMFRLRCTHRTFLYPLKNQFQQD
jgi:hypothetical protein